MIVVRFTPESRADLRDIALDIAERNSARAHSYVDEIESRCQRVAEFLHAGPPRPQWGEGVRIVLYGRYVIVYRLRDETVQILRVVHGARDLDRLFEDEPLPE
jgi:toxin ParE1/3/4